MVCKIFASEGSDLEIKLDYKGPIKTLRRKNERGQASDDQSYSKYAQNDKEDDFKKMPVTVVSDLEQYQFSSTERIHGLSSIQIRD